MFFGQAGDCDGMFLLVVHVVHCVRVADESSGGAAAQASAHRQQLLGCQNGVRVNAPHKERKKEKAIVWMKICFNNKKLVSKICFHDDDVKSIISNVTQDEEQILECGRMNFAFLSFLRI